MAIILRQEIPNDYTQVFNIIEQTFKTEPFSDFTEQFLVERLRKSDTFIPELSIIAENVGELVGHIPGLTITFIKKEIECFLISTICAFLND